MKCKKILKIIGIILLILLVLILIHTIRNFIIIKNLQNQIAQYVNSENYYIKSVTSENNGVIVKTEYYQKDDKQVVLMERDNNGEKTKISMYNNGERINTFTETLDAKSVKLNSPNSIVVQIVNVLQTDNNWQTFLYSIISKVKKVEYNGKECYSIDNFLSPYYMYGTEKNEVYIEKDTGLLLKQTIDDITTQKEYQFNNVDDSIFIEPDISQYTLQEDK